MLRKFTLHIHLMVLLFTCGLQAETIKSSRNIYPSKGYQNDSTVQFTCFNARIPTQSDGFCSFVKWTSTHMYYSQNFSVYEPTKYVEESEQHNYAGNLYSSFVSSYGGKDLDDNCISALKRLVCVSVFSQCVISAYSINYFPTCRLQCEQVNSYCPSRRDCSVYPIEGCSIFVPTGFFVIKPSSGPLTPLPAIYAIALLGCMFFAIAWNYLTFVKHKNSCVVFCRAVSGIPIIKTLVLIFGVSFWGTCSRWNMCSFWLGVSLVNTQLVYETAQMFVFILVAKGWTITRDIISTNEWRTIILAISIFYLLTSVLLVLQTTVLTLEGFWIMNFFVYGSMYGYIYSCVCYQLFRLYKQVSLLRPEMPQDITRPLKMKFAMYIAFFLLVIMSAIMVRN